MNDVESSAGTPGFKSRWRELRARLRAHLPASRKEIRRLLLSLDSQRAGIDSVSTQLHDLAVHLQHVRARIQHIEQQLAVSDYLLALPGRASDARTAVRLPLQLADAKEVCFLVTYAGDPSVPSHVSDHVSALKRQGIHVLLIVNTPHNPEELHLEPSLAEQLSGCMIRENLGFDFAAWAHAFCVTHCPSAWQRLFLINDSLLGPLDEGNYAKTMQRVRESSADLVGLTLNSQPRPHIQSYFLVINDRLLRSNTFRQFMHGIVNLPTKDAVIGQYETQLTRYLISKQFQCEALFAVNAPDPAQSDPSFHHWAQLIDAGFPFIKRRVLEYWPDHAELAGRVPQRFLETRE